MANYTIQKINKKTITLTSVEEGRVIENLTPFEAYSIIHTEDIPNAVTAFIERLDLMPDSANMFGSEIKLLVKNSFHPIMKDAETRIAKLAEDLDD